MSGMADVVKAHRIYDRGATDVDAWWNCLCGTLRHTHGGDLELATDHAAHVAAELTKAGFGNVQEAIVSAADKMEQDRATWCLDDTARYWIGRTLNELREDA